jgi:hypothetical protein
VITNAIEGNEGFVYVAAFSLDQGKAASRWPTASRQHARPTLAEPVALSNGGKDLYIQQDKFAEQFAADVPRREARTAAATQRPIAESALGERSGTPA